MRAESFGVPISFGTYTVRYLPDGTNLSMIVDPPTWAPETPAVIADHPRLRAVIHPGMGRPYIQLLRWADGTDLTDLDERVANGNHNDEDFSSCYPAYIGSQRCRNCGQRTTAVLPDPGTPPATPQRAQQHHWHNTCPHCHHPTLTYFELVNPNQ